MPQAPKIALKPWMCLIAIGSNLPLPDKSTRGIAEFALGAITTKATKLIGKSRLFSTPAFPAGSGPDFVNAAAVCETTLSADDFLAALHNIENELGRIRSDRWAARSVDVDLLSYGDLVLPDKVTFENWRNLPLSRQKTDTPERLILPHPRMHERSFVLVPLLDIVPNWRHPVLGKTVTQMVADLPESEVESVVHL